MVIGGSAGESAKRIVELEFQCMKLNLENINLKEDVMEVKGKEEKMMKKYVKVKDRYLKVMEKCNSDMRKWSEEEEKIREECRQVEAEKKKLAIDLKEAIKSGSDEVAESSLMAKIEQFKSLSEDNGRTITALLAKNKALESHNSRLETDFEAQMAVEAKKKKMEEDKTLKLTQKIQALEREKREMEAVYCKMKEDKSNEVERIKEMSEESDRTITALLAKIKDLEGHNSRLETKKLKMEEEKILELAQKIKALERENADMEAEYCKMKEDNNNEAETIKAMSEESDCTIATLVAKVRALESHNHRLETDFEAQMAVEAKKQKMEEEKILKLAQKIQALEREKVDMEAEYCKIKEDKSNEAKRIKALFEKSDRTITTLAVKIKALESHNHMLETDFKAQMALEAKKQKMEEEKVLELAHKIQSLERVKGEMEAECCKMKEDKHNEAEKKIHENKLFESAKNIIEMLMKKIDELVKSAAVVERVNEAEKRAMEDEGNKKVSELTRKIEVLERDNKEMEAKFCLLNSKQIEEFKRILDESKKKVSERIGALERENRELEAEARRANRERSEEIKKILNEKTSLEREKQELEVEARERDVKMKLLVQEKECLEAKTKIMEIKTNWHAVESEVDVELPQQVLPARNVAILSSIAAQNRGPKSVDASVTKPEESSDGSIQKRKVEELGCSATNQVGLKRCKLDGVVERKLAWKNRSDMLNDITDNDELCMRSVCALYRKYKSLSDSKNRLRSPGYIGFMPPYETRGMALGKLLTSGDPEGRIKMSSAEFEQVDPCGVQDCRIIAKHNHKEVFGIYKNNLDPLFISGDDINSSFSSSLSFQNFVLTS